VQVAATEWNICRNAIEDEDENENEDDFRPPGKK